MQIENHEGNLTSDSVTAESRAELMRLVDKLDGYLTSPQQIALRDDLLGALVTQRREIIESIARRYFDAFIGALRECGHSQADISRAIVTYLEGEMMPKLPEPAVKGAALSLFTDRQMDNYAKDYAAALRGIHAPRKDSPSSGE